MTSWDRGMSDNELINVGTVVITNGSDSVHLLVDIERGDIGHWT
jgi:hypothetical protein